MLKLFRRNKRGQSTIEYSVLVIIALGVFLAMTMYVKRGVQGRWKESVDDLGDQYDPRFGNSVVLQEITSNTQTNVFVVNDTGSGGYWTMRTDSGQSVDKKTGNIVVGGYNAF